jgi:hypothetical protein
VFAAAPLARAQTRPYIGYVYPAGGQQATTVQVRLGGQSFEDVGGVIVTGGGVSATITDNYRRLNNQEIQLVNEQLRELKRPPAAASGAKAAPPVLPDPVTQALIAMLEARAREWVQTPACASISSLMLVAVTIAPDAEVGPREIRLMTSKGISNPLVFEVGQLPEYVRKPMLTATIQTLGKEAQALRKRPPAEAEVRVELPCTVNGQIASGEVNRYSFSAAKGQRLVLAAQGRGLVPFIADAVPGWFQPVMVVYDAQGREVAFADDYRFKPDPVILFQVPQDGEYVCAIYDSIYRGREDFVYRITVGELPFITSLFPLGAKAGAAVPPAMTGWNLQDADLAWPAETATPGVRQLVAGRMGYGSNRVPFVLEKAAELMEREPNNTPATAQPVTLPAVVNGRIDRNDDRDTYEFYGKADDRVVIAVEARRLDSPLDSVVTLTDAAGKVVAFNDDREDLAAGLNTHQADSYLTAKLPANGRYLVQIRDTARKGGEEYGYRLRISAPQPDFELRVVPSSVSLATNSTAAVTVHALRRDGYTGPIKLTLKNPPAGLTAAPVTLPANQNVARFVVKSGAATSDGPVRLTIEGSAKPGAVEIVHAAVPTEDKMQAFLWRHLVPAKELVGLVFDPKFQPAPKRIPPVLPPPAAAGVTTLSAGGNVTPPAPPKFTKQQIVGRLRQLKLLYEEGYLRDDFYLARVAECETPAP